MQSDQDIQESMEVSGPQSSRGRERYARILHAATELFLEEGYSKTSIDRILERSGGSKATLYSYFQTKDELFRAVLDSVLANSSLPVPILNANGDARATLVAFSRQRLGVVFSTSHQALLRVIIAERKEFPDVARTYYERGPQLTRQLLATYLGDERVLRDLNIRVKNPTMAAELRIGMLLHEHYAGLLVLGKAAPDEEQRAERAELVVDYFLAAHRIA